MRRASTDARGRALDTADGTARRQVLAAGTPSVRSPLFPLPAVGAGGNMVVDTDALRGVGGFDPLLGAGTATHAGEETKVFAQLLRAGETALHWPGAVTWHWHRADDAALASLRTFPAEVIITDLFMPGREGIETIMEVRRQYPKIKIIAFSGGAPKTGVSFLTLAQKLGAHKTLIKPFSADEMLAALHHLLPPTKPAAEPASPAPAPTPPAA